jgi:hypothetical protein
MRTSDWRRVLLWLLLVKLVYLASVYGALRVWPAMEEGRFFGVMQRWPREGGPVFASHFATWDAAHYLYLSEVGYAKDVPSCAFYPLWPLLVRAFAVLMGGSHLVAGMVLANVLSLAAWVVFHEVVAARFGEPVTRWALVWLILFPGSVFYQFIYSEPVFFLLVMVLWWGLERGRYGWACVAAALLPLARGVGLFVALPIAWHLVTKKPPEWLIALWGRVRRYSRAGILSAPAAALKEPVRGAPDAAPAVPLPGRLEARPTLRRRAWRDYALLVAPLIGWGAYLLLMRHWTGNPLEGLQAQKHWAVHSISNLWNVPKFVIGLFEPTEWHAFWGSLLDRCLFIVLLYTLPVQWRLGKDLLVWIYVLGILPAMSGTFTSYTRFESTAFPVFIALAAFLNAEGGVRTAESSVTPVAPRLATLASRLPRLRVAVRWALLGTFAVLHLWLLWRFVNFRWAG